MLTYINVLSKVTTNKQTNKQRKLKKALRKVESKYLLAYSALSLEQKQELLDETKRLSKPSKSNNDKKEKKSSVVVENQNDIVVAAKKQPSQSSIVEKEQSKEDIQEQKVLTQKIAEEKRFCKMNVLEIVLVLKKCLIFFLQIVPDVLSPKPISSNVNTTTTPSKSTIDLKSSAVIVRKFYANFFFAVILT
jgi:hypothetical protein